MRAKRYTKCKGRDARGRIKKGYKLTSRGLVKCTGGRRRSSSSRRKRGNSKTNPFLFSRSERASLGFGI